MDPAAGGAIWPVGRRHGVVLGNAPGTPADGAGGGGDSDSIRAIKALAAQAPDPYPGNEVALLHNRFIELAQQIAGQWDRLADSDRQRREFIANISHDLRTPLTSLLGYLETLSLKDDRLTAQERKQYLNIALRRGNKVRHLSQQLFELARLEHGGIKPQPEKFILAELIQDVAQKFDLAIATREIRLRTELASGLPLVEADLSMMERVLTNLLDNAIRHTPHGGEIRLSSRQQGHRWWLRWPIAARASPVNYGPICLSGHRYWNRGSRAPHEAGWG